MHLLAAVLAPALLVAGCGGSESGAGSAELCTQYDELVASADDFRELDTTGTSVDELRSRADDFNDRPDELQEVAEGGRLETALANLEERLDTLRRAAAEAGEDAREDVAETRNALQQIVEQWGRVRAQLAERCS